MRKILFRGKVKGVDNTDKWVKGGFHIWEKRMPAPMGNDKLQENEISYVITINSFADWNMPRTMQAVEVMPETVGQYTGLKDANGTKIFEGDIFKFNDEVFDSYETDCGTEYDSCEVENYAVVGFCENTGKFDFIKYKFYNNQVEADLHENHDIEFYDFISKLEVIGNIHDNPELLKGVRE